MRFRVPRSPDLRSVRPYSPDLRGRAGHGEPSPSTIRPIEIFSGAILAVLDIAALYLIATLVADMLGG